MMEGLERRPKNAVLSFVREKPGGRAAFWRVLSFARLCPAPPRGSHITLREGGQARGPEEWAGWCHDRVWGLGLP